MNKFIFPFGHIKIGNTHIFQYRPDKFVQLQDGKVIGKLPKREVARLYLIDHFGEVESGVIELAMAISAVAAIFTTINFEVTPMLSKEDSLGINLLIRIPAFIVFFISSYSAGRLYYTYFLQKFPEVFLAIGFNVNLLQKYYIDLWISGFAIGWNNLVAIIFRKKRKAIEVSQGEISRLENNIGYMNLLIAFAAIWFIIIVLMTVSLVQDITMLLSKP